MRPIKDLLDKIMWDERENPEDYTIYYYDRVSKELVRVDYDAIKKKEGSFLIIEKDNEEANIPTHRIREVRKNNKIVWRR